MKPLAIIPARAGSKRLPGKNKLKLGTRSLIEIAVDTAVAADLAPHVIVSTDYSVRTDGMALISAGLPVFHHFRPAHLATDETPMMDVVRAVVEFARYDETVCDVLDGFDTVVLLQPTSPLRTAADVRAALELMEERHGDGVISVTHVEAPELFTIGHAQRLRPIQDGGDRRLVAPNGAIFAITTEALDAGLDWWTASGVYAYEMPPERSVDIDTIADFEEAERLWSQRS